MEDMHKAVKDLITKAGAAKQPSDAMHYSQAALNAANAMCSLKAAKD